MPLVSMAASATTAAVAAAHVSQPARDGRAAARGAVPIRAIRADFTSAGGTARVPGLVDLLREEFAMPVEELNPFRKVLVNPGKHSEDQIREMGPRLAIAVGLALRSFD